MAALERTFRAMNTSMRVLLYPSASTTDDCRQAMVEAEAGIRSQEARFSRFLPDSELSRLNRSSGSWVQPSPDMLEVLVMARDLTAETGGLFDPGVLPALEWSGYDRTFEALPADRRAHAMPLLAGAGMEAFEFGEEGRVRLAAGCRIDLGGIVKGWTADRVADSLAHLGAVLVDLGGDIAVRGLPPGGASWRIGVESPDGCDVLSTAIEVRQGGVATSGTSRRRWRTGGMWMHHIIDPRTCKPAQSDVRQVVALADSAVRADVWAKTALILGQAGCEAALERIPNLELLLMRTGNAAMMTSGIRLYLDQAA